MTLDKFIKIHKFKSIARFFLVILLIFIFFWKMNLSFYDYVHSFKRFSSVIHSMLRIDFSDYGVVLYKVFETFLIAFSSTIIAVFCAVLVTPFLTNYVIKNKILLKILNLFFSSFRTIPALVFATVLVSLIGAGSFTGFISMLIITFFASVKLLREYLEEIPERQILSFKSLGISKFALFKSCILPYSKSYIYSVFFITLESSIRGASVLGMVGAGGIGVELWKNLSYLRYDKVAFIILTLLIFIFFTDSISWFFRKKNFFEKNSTYEDFKKEKIIKKIVFIILLLLIYISIKIITKDMNSISFPIFWERLTTLFQKITKFDASYFKKSFLALLESFYVAFFATIFGALTAILISFFAASNLSSVKISMIVKFFINFIRTFPPVIVAVIFFAGFGPGLISGFFALYFYTTGVITKIYTDVIESSTIDYSLYGKSVGLKKIYIYFKIWFPSTYNNFVSIVLYRLESNMKNSSVLGMVGAGGIGELLINNIGFRNWEKVWVLFFVLILAIALIEYFSNYVRSKLKY